jgi:hypothetical protein
MEKIVANVIPGHLKEVLSTEEVDRIVSHVIRYREEKGQEDSIVTSTMALVGHLNVSPEDRLVLATSIVKFVAQDNRNTLDKTKNWSGAIQVQYDLMKGLFRVHVEKPPCCPWFRSVTVDEKGVKVEPQPPVQEMKESE